MGDENIGQLVFVFQLVQKLQHLGLDGNVQSGNRLIADDEFRVYRQRPGNANALPLTAGEFIGIPGHIIPGQVDRLQQVADFFDAFFLALDSKLDQRVFQRAKNRKGGV